MSKIYVKGGAIIVEGVATETLVINPAHFDYQKKGSDFYIRDGIENQSYNLGAIGTIQDKNGVLFASETDLLYFLNSSVNRTDVNIQDQHTPSLFVNFNKIKVNTTLSVDAIKDTYYFNVIDSTGMAIGDYLIVFNATSNRYGFFIILNIAVNLITVDRLIDFAYPAGSNVDAAIKNLNVDGSSMPQIFGIRGIETGNEVPTSIDITKIIFECIATSAVDLEKFGNLTALTRGLLLRKRDGTTINAFNLKSNGEIAGINGNWIPYASTNPVQGVDGFISVLTLAGQQNIGVTQRLNPGEDLEFIVQDDLTGLTKLAIIAEGHVVEE